MGTLCTCRLIAAWLLTAIPMWAETPAGRWDATITMGKLKVPFTMQFEGEGTAFAGTLVNGDARVRSALGSFDGKAVRLQFPDSGARLEATLDNGGLTGTLTDARSGVHRFEATAFCTCGFVGEAGPDIAGVWELPDAGWRMAIRRLGDDTLAAVSRGDDKIGPVTGRFNGAFFVLSYFDGSRAALMELELRKDGGLDVVWNEPGMAAKTVTAVRARGPQ